ncbi:hypothetical protein L484_027340 [Morus notabilis]|uniref:Uncharacterized protein n=1 Tax=Morus notabilis TaxID=981085 RepID=W9QJV9_9ROSA|nr:hypothetical protein L484_027340 [Morus notabilis]
MVVQVIDSSPSSSISSLVGHAKSDINTRNPKFHDYYKEVRIFDETNSELDPDETRVLDCIKKHCSKDLRSHPRLFVTCAHRCVQKCLPLP